VQAQRSSRGVSTQTRGVAEECQPRRENNKMKITLLFKPRGVAEECKPRGVDIPKFQ